MRGAASSNTSQLAASAGSAGALCSLCTSGAPGAALAPLIPPLAEYFHALMNYAREARWGKNPVVRWERGVPAAPATA